MKGRLVVAIMALAACGGPNASPADAPLADAIAIDAADAAPDAAIDAPETGNPAQLVIDHSTLALSATVVGATSAPATLTVTNTGDHPTGPLAVTVAGATFAATGTCTGALAPSQACTVDVTFSPTAVGLASAKITISGAPGGGVAATVRGTGITVGPATLLVTSDATPLGGVLVGEFGQTVETFSVTNTGSMPSGPIGPLQSAGPDPGDFAIEDHCATRLLAGGDSCVFAVRLNPHDRGAVSSDIEVTAEPGGDRIVTVAGTGLAPARLVTLLGQRDAGAVPAGGSTTLPLTLTNTGDIATLPISVTLVGGAAFTFGGGTCATAVVAPGGSCTVLVVLGGAPPGDYAGQVTAIGSPDTPRVLVTLAGTITPAAQLKISPPAVELAPTLLGAPAPQVFTVTNSGTVPSGALVPSITNAGPFAITASTCANQSLAPADTCTITTRFQPLVVGPGAARVRVVSPALGFAFASLTGAGITGPNLVLERSAVDFGSVAVGASSATSLTLTNLGGQPAPMPVPTVSGTNAAELAVTHDCPAAIAPGASCTITLRFTPAATGARTALLSAGGATASLTGAAIPSGGVTITPSLRAFAATSVDESTTTGTFVVRNTGASSITDLSVTGGATFPIISSCLSTLGAGESCLVTAKFSPTSPGPATGAITVTGGGSSASSSLTGQGLVRFELVAIDGTPSAPASYDFGSLSLTSPLRDDVFVTLRNNSSIGWFFEVDDAYGTPPEFANLGNPCLGTVSGHGTCTVHLAFTPSSPGAKAGTVTFVMKENLGADAWRIELPFGLAGIGVAP